MGGEGRTEMNCVEECDDEDMYTQQKLKDTPNGTPTKGSLVKAASFSAFNDRMTPTNLSPFTTAIQLSMSDQSSANVPTLDLNHGCDVKGEAKTTCAGE